MVPYSTRYSVAAPPGPTLPDTVAPAAVTEPATDPLTDGCVVGAAVVNVRSGPCTVPFALWTTIRAWWVVEDASPVSGIATATGVPPEPAAVQAVADP